ncbi:hypothetical protein [Syntrophomonas palmitatica]|uniref:hypothetical protein n=1 Tax=Syntrophomonas palmitatica TaxID=402877 RepID=UPI0006CFB97C|nr:hypothetical protein [Syntrophomonas palmitatica]
MYQFKGNGVTVYTDLVVLHNREIIAVSIIGSEIAVKAVRAQFLDENAKRRIEYYQVETEKSTRYWKPAAEYRQFPQIKTEQGLQVFLMHNNLFWGLTQDDRRVRAYQNITELNIPCPTPSEKEFTDCMDRIIKAGLQTKYLVKCEVLSPQLKLQAAKFYLIDPMQLEDFKQAAENIIASYLEDDDIAPENFLVGINGVADYIERYAKL